jgi:hypothetical protein
MNEVKIQVAAQNRFQTRHLLPAAWSMQPLMAHITLPRTLSANTAISDVGMRKLANE